ncbi:hypothetical protein J2Y69_002008 [Microbacterium resistens]|uniref:Elongation factor G-binding protein C-terminal treble-clef zinc-finger domain-containing protein n=1 Tax=Microbacterium resistens TaxID=156977 RepID=A0ABU1SCT9_9MICO|nr:FBP domain-containing protein [Microbacterium resistens]MDR6867405.1 hypothetical protein [Microbacterium resistens]
MQRLSRADVRGALEHTVTTGRRIHLPADFDDLNWGMLDYLGWKDPRSPLRSYLLAVVDGRLEGLRLERVAPPQLTHGRAVMCNLCHFSRRFHEVSMFVTRNPSASRQKQLNAVGTMLCTDLDCAANVHTAPPQGPYDPPIADVIAARRAGLQSRVAAFIRSTRATTGSGRL